MMDPRCLRRRAMNSQDPKAAESSELGQVSERKNLINGVVLGTLVGVLLELGGYLLARGNRSDFGVVMFVAVPFVSGFAVAAVVRWPRRLFACVLAGGLI